MVLKCQQNEVHSLTLQYLHLNQPNKNLIFWKEQWKCQVNVWELSFNRFELPNSEEDNCCSWKVHSLPNHDLLTKSNFWWYLQLISATLHAYWSTGTCCALKTCSSCYRRSLIPPKWMILSHRRALDIYTERIPPSLCLLGWLLGWIHSVDPWYHLTWHQGVEHSTYEVLHRWIVHER